VEDLVGSMIAGKYRVKRRIGAGGMGAVYEGEHVEIGKRVAIKVIEHEHARSDELAARFRREARAASAVESEHIVQVFDVGTDEKAGLFMVMEMLSGEDLATRLEKAGGRLPVDDAVTIIVQAARALAKAHAAGVVHRDLKPANLFLTSREDGSVCVKLLDFGISKLVRPESGATSSSLTREGSVMGTPMYMSPEQAQGLAVDPRTDLWSLGAVLYEALAGQRPYADRDTYEQMIVQIVTQKPKPLREVAPHVGEELARVVEATLVHELDARMSDAATFARQLGEAAGKGPTSSPSTSDVNAATVQAGAFPDSARARIGSDPGSGRVVVSNAATPPTATGVEIGARTQLDAGIPPRRSPLVWVGAAGAIAVALGVGFFATRTPPKPASAAGLVAPPPPAPPTETPIAPGPALSALPAAGTSATASAEPAASAKPEASAKPVASAKPAASPKPAASAGTGTHTQHGVTAAPPASAKPAGAPPSQWGAAGVSTAY
jgi:serine/threonine protein kinase